MSEIDITDSGRLDMTQDVRQMVIDKMVNGGKVQVEDPKELAILVKTLDSMDKQVFGKAKQKSLEKEVDNAARQQAIVAAVFKHAIEDTEFDDPTGGGRIPEPDLGGEDDVPEFAKEQGISDETFEEFDGRMDD